MENENKEPKEDVIEEVSVELRNAAKDFIRKFGGEEFKLFVEVMKGQDETVKIETLKVLQRLNMGMSKEFNPLLVLTGWSAKVAIDIPKFLENYLYLFKAGLIGVSNQMTANMKEFQENVEKILGDKVQDLNDLVKVIQLLEATIMAQQNDVLALGENKKKDISEYADSKADEITKQVISSVSKAIPSLYKSVRKELEVAIRETKRMYFLIGCVCGGCAALGLLIIGIELGKKLA